MPRQEPKRNENGTEIKPTPRLWYCVIKALRISFCLSSSCCAELLKTQGRGTRLHTPLMHGQEGSLIPPHWVLTGQNRTKRSPDVQLLVSSNVNADSRTPSCISALFAQQTMYLQLCLLTDTATSQWLVRSKKGALLVCSVRVFSGRYDSPHQQSSTQTP